uniref:Uncharacterized protein n=1 Tax=Panagrolaimus davidi TaxID=227884 RepID=A0A914QG59_9BILA
MTAAKELAAIKEVEKELRSVARESGTFKEVVERDFRSFTRDLKSLSEAVKKLDDKLDELSKEVGTKDAFEFKELMEQKLVKLDNESAEAILQLHKNHEELWEKMNKLAKDLDELKGSDSGVQERTRAPTVPSWLSPETQQSCLASVAQHLKDYREKQADDNSDTSNALSYILKQIEINQQKPGDKETKKLTAEMFTGEYHLENFTGSPFMSFANWHKRFEYSLAFVQIPPNAQQKLARLLAHLHGAAKLAYEEYDAAVQADYDQLVTALTASFTNAAAKRTANAALTYCTQKENESVHDFSTRLTELVRTAMEGEQPATVKAVLTLMLKGKIRDDIKAKINVHECTTYEEVLKKALDRENYQNQKNQVEEKQPKAESESNFVEKSSFRCFHCKKEGHFARECPEGRRRQIAPEYRTRNYRNNSYRSKSPGYDYRRNEPSYRSKSPGYDYRRNEPSYRSKSPGYDYRRNESSNSYRSKSPARNGHRSKSPSNPSYRNDYQQYRQPRERYNSASEGETGRNSSAERKSPGPRRIRFADTNVTEPEGNAEIEFFNFEFDDLSEEESTEEDLVAFTKYFGNNDNEFEYLHEEIEEIPIKALFQDDSEILNDIYTYNKYPEQQKSKVIVHDPQYLDKIISNQKRKNRARRLRTKAKKEREKLMVTPNPNIKKADEPSKNKKTPSQRSATKSAKSDKRCNNNNKAQLQLLATKPDKHNSDEKWWCGNRKPKLQSVVGKWITVSMIALTLLGIVGADPVKPLFCNPKVSKMLFKLPENSICHNVNWIPEETPNFASFNILRPNTIAYKTPATYCYCQNTTGTHTRTLGNDDVYSPEVHQSLHVSATECTIMRDTKISKYGELHKALKSYATNNSLEFPDRRWPLSLQTDHDDTQNCYLHPTEVIGHHDDEFIFKQYHNDINCKYSSGVCDMKEGGTLIWEPETQEKCEFIQWEMLDGDLSSNIWISRNRELALTFKNMRKVEDCNTTFLVSDQGFAVHLHEYDQARRPNNTTKVKREAVGIVETPQFAGQLTAAEQNALSVTKQYFKNALYHICQTADTLADAIISLAASNPTLLARKLLNAQNIQARLVTESLMEVTVCEELNITQVLFTQQQHCYDAMPVSFYYSTDLLHGFMDMITGIVSNFANEVDCERVPYFYLELPDYKVKQIDQRTGHIEYVKEPEELNFKSPKLQAVKDEHMYFKNLVVTNLTEIFNYQIFYDATKQAETFANLANHVDKVKSVPGMKNYYEKIVDHANNFYGYFNFSFENISWYNFWVFLNCLTVTTAVCILILLLFIAYWFNWFRKIRKLPGFRSNTSPTTLFPKDYRTPEEILESIRVHKLSQKQKKPRPKSEMYANETSFRAVGYTTAKLIQKTVKSLIDTGSGIFVITTACLEKMKGKLEFKPLEVDLMGLSSTSVTTMGIITAEFEICGWKGITKFAVIDSSTRKFAYDILIGGNTLKQMPEIIFNFQKNYIRIDNTKQHLGFEKMNQQADVFNAEPDIVIQRPNVTPAQQKKIDELLNEFSDRFSKSDFDIDQDCELVAPPLEVEPGTKPIAAKLFKVAEKLRPVIYAFITALLAAKIIVEANTPWLSNVFAVRKPNGKYRAVVDLRALNAVLIKDFFPLPNMENILQIVSGCYYYTICDLSAAFYQLNVDEKSSNYLGIITIYGIFKFVKMPMGGKNSPSAFQRAMKKTLRKCTDFAVAYLDDILIFTRVNSFAEHLNHIRQVFMALREEKLKIRADKTRIAERSITFLGHEISKDIV